MQISKIVEEFIKTHMTGHKIQYITFQNGVDLLFAIEKGQFFDVLLLDVVMPIMNGIQLADEIRKSNSVSKIIFITTASEYAVDSYDVDAFYYLLKPIKNEKLIPLLEKAFTDVIDHSEKHIIIKNGANFSKIILSRLQYVEVNRRTLSFHVKNGEVLSSTGSMAQTEAILLSDKRYIKPHRSYIVNMDFIKNFSSTGITTVTNELIPVSRNVYGKIKQAYIDYSFNGGKKLFQD